MLRTLVVIPVYNEVDNIRVLLRRIFKHYPNISILVIDDSSPDGSGLVCREMQNEFSNLHLEVRAARSGLGTAYRFGFVWAIKNEFQRVVEMDADLSHRVRDLVKMLSFSDQHPEADLIIGSRWITGGKTENWPLRRQFLSRAANLYVRLMLGMGVNDATAGFRIYSTNLLRKISLGEIKSEGYSFQIEMTRAAKLVGANIVEIPITFRERKNGISKMSGAIVREAILLVTAWGIKRFFRL